MAKSSSLLSSFRGSSTYNHETETIFALPRMQLDFKSNHVQDPEEPSLTGETLSMISVFFFFYFPSQILMLFIFKKSLTQILPGELICSIPLRTFGVIFCQYSVVVVDASSKPNVECSVVTEFTDHICVTMDAELIMFLHDLVSAYLKEKENGENRGLREPMKAHHSDIIVITSSLTINHYRHRSSSQTTHTPHGGV